MMLLSACASNIPIEIRQDVTERNISVHAVRTDVDQYEGHKIRWGGTIASVENKASDTWIEVVGKVLNSSGRPVGEDESLGRFMVRIDGFLDPTIYKPDRDLTIYGTVESRIVREIDEHPYTYPLIKAESYYLWSDYVPRRHYAYRYPYGYYYPYYSGFYIGHHFGHHYGHHYGRHHYGFRFGLGHHYYH